MPMPSPVEAAPPLEPAHLVEPAVALVEQWLQTSHSIPVAGQAAQLTALLADPHGLEFAVGFIDGVIRPEDPRAAADQLRRLARDVPRSIPPHLRAGLRLAAAGARVAPQLVVPVVRRALRAMVGHLVVDASDRALTRQLSRLTRDGAKLNVNLLGEAVLGRCEADRRLAQLLDLVHRPDVDHISVKVSAVIAPHSPWAFDEAVDDICARLTPLYRAAHVAGCFINLDMEEYRDLRLTTAVFRRLLDADDLLTMRAGIVLQAYLPEALPTLRDLTDWSSARVARGGAPIKVRVVKGANLPMEVVESQLRGWPRATWSTKQQTDSHYLRLLNQALRPEHTQAVRIGIAGHNLFDLAWAWLLATERGVQHQVEVEMLLGMAPAQAEAVRRTTGSLLLYTPVVHPQHFDVAISYLVRRLDEGASPQNFLSAVTGLADEPALFARERDRFTASVTAMDEAVPVTFRTQDRTQHPSPAHSPSPFTNEPDTDPALPANLAWGRAVLARLPLPPDDLAAHRITTPDALETTVDKAIRSATGWADLGAAGRAQILRRAADELSARRADLLAVMADECGKTLDQGDPEVSEAIDFARWYADCAEQLDHLDGATQVPPRLIVVTPPWNFPLAIPAGSTLAALAVGASVIIKPAPQAERCGVAMVEALWAAGVPRDVLQVALVPEGTLGQALISDPRVDRVVLTGGYETAEMFLGWRPGLSLLAETSGKNAIIVAPSADVDLAVKDVVASAFGHAGQKCSAASLVILVGQVARSRRFREQLIDAVESLAVGWPDDPRSQVGPLITPAAGKLADALTRLEAGQSWWVEPRPLDDSGRLWSPGVRGGVRPASEFARIEYFGPVLGVMAAETLDEAIAWQNAVDYGLTAGLHTQQPADVTRWADRVQAGNLYVNRGITGAIVRRQPFGGWKKSAVGPGAKAGGPNYLLALSDWVSAPAAPSGPITSAGLALLAQHITLSRDERDFLDRAFRSDARAAAELGAAHDPTGLEVEANLLRYRPTPVLVRVGADASPSQVLRVVGAGLALGADKGSPIVVSCAGTLPGDVVRALAVAGVRVRPRDHDWVSRLGHPHHRVRLIGIDRADVAREVGARADVALYDQPVTESGRLEGLVFVHEQAVCVTNHRFGEVRGLSDAVSG
ncbi:proline dehydrogenase family protein [Propionibacteriaceae bacterium G57]|uniref:proline dehydrogenase family protein n=1 Tax=Aestuariimicrobium sp. G57 TaxID=3418485 RepID=UPI003DA76896